MNQILSTVFLLWDGSFQKIFPWRYGFCFSCNSRTHKSNCTKEIRGVGRKIGEKHYVKYCFTTSFKRQHAAIVIPAHANNNSPFDIIAVKHTKGYIQFYEEALKTNKTSAALIAALKAKYPTLSFETALQIGAKVNTGEMKW